MKIELNQNEAAVLLQMIDVAVKSLGMGAAEAGVHLTKLIAAAAKAEGEAQAAPAEPVAAAA